MGIAVEHRPQGNEVILQIRNDLATIFLGGTEDKVVTIDDRKLLSLGQAVQEAMRQGVKGLVIIGPHENMFSVGVDVSWWSSIPSAKSAEDFSRRGQEILNYIAELPIPTVAAISGACLGEGYELALACKYRLAASNSTTRIGLPQLQFGLIPALGGGQRLTQLVGLPKALDLISNARLITADSAYRLGLVDQVILNANNSVYAALRQAASELALGRIQVARYRPSMRDRLITRTAMGRKLAIQKITKETSLRSRGRYPAPERAIGAIGLGLRSGMKAGLQEEAKSLAELIAGSECRSLLHLHVLRESAKKLGRVLQNEAREAKIAVIGVGGSAEDLCLTALASGNQLIYLEPNSQNRERAYIALDQAMVRRFGSDLKELESARNRLQLADRFSAIAAADVVLEAVGDDFETKSAVLHELNGAVRRDALIAASSSVHSLSKYSGGIDGPERLVGMQFFPSAARSGAGRGGLVEIRMVRKAKPRNLSLAAALSVHLGRVPVFVEDIPGGLVNQLLAPYFLEACYLLAEGYPVRTIDLAVEGFGMAMGPFRAMDEMGLDVVFQLHEQLKALQGERLVGPEFAKELLGRGRIGRKSGAGFYRYHGRDFLVDASLEDSMGIKKKSTNNPALVTYIASRLILVLVNEAVRILDQGVVGKPGRDAAGQIDLASVLGFGFPTFRGGLIHYGNSIGVDKLEEHLADFALNIGARYKPWQGILERASRGASLYDARG